MRNDLKMEAIKELITIDYTSLFIAVFTILIGLKAIVSVFEWGINKLGLETKWIKARRQEHELLIQTSQGLIDLQKRHSDIDKQIDSLMVAQREVLADRINQKYKYYISIKGIPEDEIEEFTNLHDAYKGVGGNHSGDAKYEYCINHLSVVPVETKLITNNYLKE